MLRAIAIVIIGVIALPGPMQPSQQLKQSFRIIALLATVLVVMIHYRSADTLGSGLQGWAQEWVVNGVARIAVPLFAFAAGFFFFVSATGTLDNYLDKLRQRARSLALPYLLMSIFALTSWAALRVMTGTPITLSGSEIGSRLFLHPMAEQLWFLRDLLVLVLVAPLIGFLIQRMAATTLVVLAGLWMAEIQPAPLLGGWYAVNIETLFFFSLGCGCVRVAPMQWLERLVRVGRRPTLLLLAGWLTVLGVRVLIDPAFDLWYVHDYTLLSLGLQKLAILLGCCSLIAVSGLLAADASQRERWNRWAGCSFFVYLIHEFPLREVLERTSGALVATEYRFWLTAPLAVLASFGVAMIADTAMPNLTAVLTGGRTPQRLQRQTLSANRSL